MLDYLRTINFTELEDNDKPTESEVNSMLAWMDDFRHDRRLISPAQTKFEPKDPGKYLSNFGFVDEERVKKTLEKTTQLATNVLRLPLCRHFKSRFPQLNRPRIREEVSSDTLFSSVTGIGEETCAQVFVGKKSLKGAVYGMATESQGHEALQNFINDHGAPYHMRTDNAQMETGKKWNEIYRWYNISSSTTEPHHPHQNPAERRIQEYKKGTNRILDRTGAPSYLWFYALLLWVGLLNVLFDPNLGTNPHEIATGYTADVSAYLDFTFYNPIYYYDEEEKFPSSRNSWDTGLDLPSTGGML